MLDTNDACRNEKERSVELTLVVLTLSGDLARVCLESDHTLKLSLKMKCLGVCLSSEALVPSEIVMIKVNPRSV